MKPTLCDIGQKYGTDKIGVHNYLPHYKTHLGHLRHEPINLLEIGVGGDEDPTKGGESLRMWQEYFTKAKIYGIDIHNKESHEDERIKIFQGSQSDTEFLNRVVTFAPDVIIDDGSHIQSHVITTFETLFPKLKDGGIYVIEDTQTAYHPSYGGGKERPVMQYFQNLTDGLNYMEQPKEPNYFEQNIVSIHFYHNLIFIYKGVNDEKSNLF